MTSGRDLVLSVSDALDRARKMSANSEIVVDPIRQRAFARIGVQGPDIVVVLPSPGNTQLRPVRLSSINVDYGVTCKVLQGGIETQEKIGRAHV